MTINDIKKVLKETKVLNDVGNEYIDKLPPMSYDEERKKIDECSELMIIRAHGRITKEAIIKMIARNPVKKKR